MEWPTSNSFQGVHTWLTNALGEDREAQSQIRALMEWIGGKSRAFLIAEQYLFSESQLNRFQTAIQALESSVPLQHIVGEVDFHGYSFAIRKGALVPRPETEELVDLIVSDFESKPPTSILDVGTGSGVIAIALKKAFPSAKVVAWDVSPEALDIAKENAERLNAEVQFRQVDALKDSPSSEFDIIVSNPPYIPTHEKKDMQSQVVNHDPGLALFVPDDDPLLFYRSISTFPYKGAIYLECHEEFTAEVAEIFEGTTTIFRDAQNKKRFVRVTSK